MQRRVSYRTPSSSHSQLLRHYYVGHAYFEFRENCGKAAANLTPENLPTTQLLWRSLDQPYQPIDLNAVEFSATVIGKR